MAPVVWNSNVKLITNLTMIDFLSTRWPHLGMAVVSRSLAIAIADICR